VGEWRPLLQVALEPYTATWVHAQIRAEVWDRACARLERNGRPDLAQGLRRDRARLAEATRQWAERFQAERAQVPSVGTSEPVGSDSAGQWPQEMTTAEAAKELGVSEVMVRRWCRDGVLVARQPHSRSWRVERSSVMDLLTVRRAS
jgi:excisionase family DNA binding protein